MKIGMIVRADHTGLGNQTWEAWRHIQPYRTLVVLPSKGAGANLPQHTDRYTGPGVLTTKWSPDPPRRLRQWAVDWLAESDIVYSAETFYDPTLCRQLDDRGVATVLHANPELYDGEEQSTDVWLPTSWLVDLVASKTNTEPIVMPMPAPTDRAIRREPDMPRRIVHPTSVAMGDRNGGAAVMRAITYVIGRNHNVTFDPVGPTTKWVPKSRTVDDWWERDAGAWMSIIPRRYGGLCLPALEAMAAGVPVLMPDVSPQNRDWPAVVTFPTNKRANPMNMKGGRIAINAPQPASVRDAMQSLMSEHRHAEAVAATIEWADANGPDQIMPRWIDRMRDVIT